MKIAIMQPTYMPWLGYFDLMDQVDTFVLLDDVQFSHQSWQQRNRIKTPKGLAWLTVPIFHRNRSGQLIREVEIQDIDFWKNHLRAIEFNYTRAIYYSSYMPQIAAHFESGSPWRNLADLNIKWIEWFAVNLGIKTPLIRSSTLNVEGKRSNRLVAICNTLGAKEYLSPLGSAEYLLNDLEIFASCQIAVTFQHYEHPTYRQLFPPFVPFASVIDLLLNEGSRSLEIIRGGRRAPYLPNQIKLTHHMGNEPNVTDN